MTEDRIGIQRNRPAIRAFNAKILVSFSSERANVFGQFDR